MTTYILENIAQIFSEDTIFFFLVILGKYHLDVTLNDF